MKFHLMVWDSDLMIITSHGQFVLLYEFVEGMENYLEKVERTYYYVSFVRIIFHTFFKIFLFF